jgi:hypothetical protein
MMLIQYTVAFAFLWEGVLRLLTSEQVTGKGPFV